MINRVGERRVSWLQEVKEKGRREAAKGWEEEREGEKNQRKNHMQPGHGGRVDGETQYIHH